MNGFILACLLTCQCDEEWFQPTFPTDEQLAAAPTLDEGDRWEQAAIVAVYGDFPRATAYFWRRETTTGQLFVAAHVEMHDLLDFLWDGRQFVFTWYDGYAGSWADADDNVTWLPAKRVCRVPVLHWHYFAEGERWQMPWNPRMGDGFLPMVRGMK